MAVLRLGSSSAVITVPDERASLYTSAGWVVVGEPTKYLSQQNKSELLETAASEGIDVDESLTRKQLVGLIESHRDGK